MSLASSICYYGSDLRLRIVVVAAQRSLNPPLRATVCNADGEVSNSGHLLAPQLSLTRSSVDGTTQCMRVSGISISISISMLLLFQRPAVLVEWSKQPF